MNPENSALVTAQRSIQNGSSFTFLTGPSPSWGKPFSSSVPIKNSPPGRRTIPSLDGRLRREFGTGLPSEASPGLLKPGLLAAQQAGLDSPAIVVLTCFSEIRLVVCF